MRILFDQGVPRGLAASLRGYDVTEARKLNWERISNGELLKLAESAGFEVLITTDKNVRYQQNLIGRKISIDWIAPDTEAELVELTCPMIIPGLSQR